MQVVYRRCCGLDVHKDSVTACVLNPYHMRNIPGRKTDQNDAEWIADLLSHGLLRASFVQALPSPAGQPVGEAQIGTERHRALESLFASAWGCCYASFCSGQASWKEVIREGPMKADHVAVTPTGDVPPGLDYLTKREQEVPRGAGADSVYVLPAILDRSKIARRSVLEHAGTLGLIEAPR